MNNDAIGPQIICKIAHTTNNKIILQYDWLLFMIDQPDDTHTFIWNYEATNYKNVY